MGAACFVQQRRVYDKSFITSLQDSQDLRHPPLPAPSSELARQESYNPLKRRRRCRDVLCLLVFVSYFTMMAGIALYAYMHGDIRRLIYGVDSNCDICGTLNEPKEGISSSGKDQTNYPFLIFQYADDIFYRARLDLPMNSAEFLHAELFFVKQCLVTCPPDYKIVLNRCQPNVSAEEPAAGDHAEMRSLRIWSGERDILAEVSEDLENTYQVIGYMCGIALGVAILTTLLLRTLAGTIVWIVIGAILASALGATAFLWLYYLQLLENPPTNNNSNNKTDNAVHAETMTPSAGVFSWEKNKTFYTLSLAILASILTFVILVIAVGMRKRISLVIRLFQEAGKAVHAMPLILLQPCWTFLCLVLISLGTFTLGVLIETAGFEEKYASREEPTERCRYVKDDFLKTARWLNVFSFFWLTQFVIACQHFVIAGTISQWFFTRKKSTLSWPILNSVERLVVYHLGSVAFGSLIIGAVKFIRTVLSFLQKRLSKRNGFCRAMTTVCQCCLWCLEKFLTFLNRNAYVEIAIYGYGFCKSAKRAFEVLVQNALRVSAINSIGDVVLFLAKAVTVIATVLIGYQMLKGREEIHNLWVPLGIGGVFAYLISNCFISVYEMAIDTIFLCFCEDCQLNDGLEKPYFMSRGLMEFVKQSHADMRQSSAEPSG